MVRKDASSLKQEHLLLLLAYLFTLSLAVVFVNWEATPYNPGYACIQTVEVFCILLFTFVLSDYPARNFIKHGLFQLLFRLLVLFGASVLIIRLNIEFTPYNVEFVLLRALKVFATLSLAMIIRLVFIRYQMKR
ncbi:hypothetical protein [Prolixibacter denitrificans]|uniref:Uncharacterized protein n=1 Tax=Prolixibacter denitrificans TaxID=1541063 RepID=A0A2P8CHG2_9BACT|nr:hypothetical protein [Prolixibacter denitrificans]PSK84415.1 hypothetical protein CLV93_102201 [Prolixibacter denitrificans]GET20589.1 hypothetical protein JCM18694_08350 [Prolixibacter denitrificans]